MARRRSRAMRPMMMPGVDHPSEARELRLVTDRLEPAALLLLEQALGGVDPGVELVHALRVSRLGHLAAPHEQSLTLRLQPPLLLRARVLEAREQGLAVGGRDHRPREIHVVQVGRRTRRGEQREPEHAPS